MVEPFSWSDAFAVGEAGLDAEHRRIVELINEICIRAEAGWRESIGSLLRELQFVSETHFRNEETVLARIAAEISQKHLQAEVWLAIEHHVRQHRRQLNKLQGFVACTDDREICEMLKLWYVEHVVREDAEVKAILQSSHLVDASWNG